MPPLYIILSSHNSVYLKRGGEDGTFSVYSFDHLLSIVKGWITPTSTKLIFGGTSRNGYENFIEFLTKGKEKPDPLLSRDRTFVLTTTTGEKAVEEIRRPRSIRTYLKKLRSDIDELQTLGVMYDSININVLVSDMRFNLEEISKLV